MIGLRIALVTLAAAALCGFYLATHPSLMIASNDCTMSFSSPSFIELELPWPRSPALSRYRLLQYNDLRYGRTYQTSAARGARHAVVFVHGSGGTHSQFRSIAGRLSQLLQASHHQARPDTLLLAVDFAGELSALSGVLLARQSLFLRRCIEHVLLPALSVTTLHVIAHSMGGTVAKIVTDVPHIRARTHSLILLGSPLVAPPLVIDVEQARVFALLRQQLAAVTVPYVSIGGGERDTLVSSEWIGMRSLYNNNKNNNNGNSSVRSEMESLVITTSAIPGVRMPVDHQCLVWCSELVQVVSEGIVDAVLGAPVASLRSHTATIIDSIPSISPKEARRRTRMRPVIDWKVAPNQAVALRVFTVEAVPQGPSWLFLSATGMFAVNATAAEAIGLHLFVHVLPLHSAATTLSLSLRTAGEPVTVKGCVIRGLQRHIVGRIPAGLYWSVRAIGSGTAYLSTGAASDARDALFVSGARTARLVPSATPRQWIHTRLPFQGEVGIEPEWLVSLALTVHRLAFLLPQLVVALALGIRGVAGAPAWVKMKGTVLYSASITALTALFSPNLFSAVVTAATLCWVAAALLLLQAARCLASGLLSLPHPRIPLSPRFPNKALGVAIMGGSLVLLFAFHVSSLALVTAAVVWFVCTGPSPPRFSYSTRRGDALVTCLATLVLNVPSWLAQWSYTPSLWHMVWSLKHTHTTSFAAPLASEWWSQHGAASVTQRGGEVVDARFVFVVGQALTLILLPHTKRVNGAFAVYSAVACTALLPTAHWAANVSLAGALAIPLLFALSLVQKDTKMK